MLYPYVQAKPQNIYSGLRICIYKNLWTNDLWHHIVPATQHCPKLTDNILVYQFCIPFQNQETTYK